jgi:hypothetical protein
VVFDIELVESYAHVKLTANVISLLNGEALLTPVSKVSPSLFVNQLSTSVLKYYWIQNSMPFFRRNSNPHVFLFCLLSHLK